MKNEILFMKPVFKEMIWGGNRLGTDWPYQIPGDDTGECWAVSAHPNGDCTVSKGTYAGQSLGTLWKEQPQLFGEQAGDRFPLLIKIIDAKSDLSIQVHPDDTYAREQEHGSLGKTECWYILDAPEDATLVIGHHARNKEELKDMISGGKWNAFIREVPVKAGDFIQIDPGTVHAIKGGIMLLETQQNSDITYRVYDYDRLQNGKPRELHVQKSIDVITVPAKPVSEGVISLQQEQDNAANLLIACSYYKVWKIHVRSAWNWKPEGTFQIMSVIEGEGKINGEEITKGDHFIVPAGFGEIQLEGNMVLIASTPVNAQS